MRRYTTLAVGALVVIGSALDAHAHGPRGEGARTSLMELLALTEVQRAEIAEMQKVALREEHRAAFELIFTQDQLDALATAVESEKNGAIAAG